MTVKLQDSVVIVTGGGSGVGRELCLQFAAEGAHVVVADINRPAADETLTRIVGGRNPGLAVTLDVAEKASWEALQQQVTSRYGHCDVLCNNAGVFRVGALANAPLEDWYLQSRINIDGVILGCKTFAPGMAERGSGHIINTASMSGLYGAPGMSTYSASKFAVVGFSQSLRNELAESGVVVSVLCPGAIDTPMNHDIDVPLEDRLIPAEAVAEQVLDSIRAGDRRHFIFTHPEFYPLLEEHFGNVLAAYSDS